MINFAYETGMTFEEEIADCVISKLHDGTIEKLIEAEVEKAIKKALDDVLGYGGDGKKLLDHKIAEVIVPVIENHNFNNYLTKLDDVLTNIVNQTTLIDNKKLLENFQHIMREPEKEEVTLSEIFEKYCEYVSVYVNTADLEAIVEDDEPYYENVTATVEVDHIHNRFSSSYDDCYINLECKEDSGLNYQLKLYKSKRDDRWTILRGIQTPDIDSLKGLSSFEIFLSVINRSYTKIILDIESDCNEDIEPQEKPEWTLG